MEFAAVTRTISVDGYAVQCLTLGGHRAIWGAGDTRAKAMRDFDNWVRWMNAIVFPSSVCVWPATAAFLAEVREKGGNIPWSVSDGVLCLAHEITRIGAVA